MKFQWDNNKNKTNFEKHGLCFEDCELIFQNKTITFKDDRKDYGEERFITLGKLEKHIVVVVHTQRELITRIISMRKANEREKEIYLKRLEETGQND